ncbi:GntR family transcriptional regulator [Thermodesulfobacteriota bacterium]
MDHVILPIAKNKSLKEQAYDALKALILTGKLERGKLYNEMKWAQQLGVSRTPVREALLELSSEGMVDFLPNRGIMIKEITIKQVREVFEIRQIIEGYVTRSFVKRVPPADVEMLEGIIKNQELQAERADHEAFFEFDRTFHLFLVSRMDNRRLESILQNLQDQIHLMGIYALEKNGRTQQVLAEHIEILKALKKRNVRKAERAMIRHLKNTELTILDMIREDKQDDG